MVDPNARPDEVKPWQPTPGHSNLTDQQRRQLDVFGPILLNASSEIDARTRRNAAAELLAMNVPESREYVVQALHSRKPAVASAAIEALHAQREPVAELRDAVVGATASASSHSLEALANVVARYGPEALNSVAAQAHDRRAAAAQRLNAIYVLGAFHTRDAAAHLMQVIENAVAHQEAAGPDLIKAACASLERSTGLAHGHDAPKWQAWWRDAQRRSSEEWFAFMTESLSARLLELQLQVQQQKQLQDRTSRELFTTYRDLFPSLSVDEQLRRLPKLMTDEVPAVREFALARLGLLLRDSVRIPDALRQQVIDRVNDDVPALRLAAVRLLDELNDERAGMLAASRLMNESSVEVLSGLLEIVARRPTPAALETVSRWLADPTLGEHAVDAAWRIVDGGEVSSERLAESRPAIRAAFEQTGSPALARLLAFVGDDRDVSTLVELLDEDDVVRRAAIAEGLCRRGSVQPLVDRADDPVVYPFAVRALSSGPADLNAVRQLVRLRPGESSRRTWSQGVVRLCAALSPADLLAADGILSASPYVDLGTRREILLASATGPATGWQPNQRAVLMARLAPILLELGEPATAHQLLETLPANAASFDSTINGLRFSAAALAGEFERAAQFQNQCSAWLELLATVAKRDAAAAAALRDEISRRFSGQMDQTQRAELFRISHALTNGLGG